MKVHHKEKMHVVNFCLKSMRDSELKAERDSIELIRKIQSLKKHKLREIEENPDENSNIVIDDTESDMLVHVDTLEDDLMQIEMLL